MNISRNKCVICENKTLSVFLEYAMPVYMGDISTIDGHSYSKIVFSECDECFTVQLKECVSPDVVYQFNHNREVVGMIWDSHYHKFAEFLNCYENKNVLEISDPTAKLAKKLNGFNKWYIVEPHSNPELDTEKIIFINQFFDENFFVNDKIDIIVHSHFFEHTLEPSDFFKKCNSLLEEGGKMFMSVPNLESILYEGYSPNNVLHFEHTFYFDYDTINYLAKKNGFKILKKEFFNKHSLFLELIKTEVENVESPKFRKNSDLFLNSYNRYKTLIDTINKSEDKFILFGCHVSSQFLIFNGLDRKKIEFIIDNSVLKQGKYLYGTDILTKSPSEISKYDCGIIVSHTGVYSREISEGLVKIKPNVKLL